jgi:hypothetical protein
MKKLHPIRVLRHCALTLALLSPLAGALASSHRESPLISRDPLADNTDVYAFRSPDDTNTVTIICNYMPFQLPEGGPNYYNFGPGVRYEIHIKNKTTTTGDDITYRFTFQQTSEDTSTFFNIRLGKQNLKTTYTCEKSTNGGISFTAIKTGGIVPPPNIGPRSIQGAAGLNAPSYQSLMASAVTTASTGETMFAGPIDDPFFVDLAGAFDLGNFRPVRNPTNPTKDGLAKFNVHTIAIKVPISMLQANGQGVSAATSILDPNYVIGVWASASRQQITTLSTNGTPSASGNWVQVSRLGMPLTNEAVIPIGSKDRWNSMTPYNGNDLQFAAFFKNPELALYMDDSQYGSAVPALNALRIQSKSLGSFDFRNGKSGLYSLKGNAALAGTALAPGPTNPGGGFGDILLPDNASPRAVDILPIFYTGVPNLAPYQLAIGKTGGPLSAGKPFINNFLPTLGDMLRLNMAVPVTPRSSPDFSPLGIVAAAALGLTDTRFNGNANIQFIPNMDGFPNGRRLEDDVTTIELQAVGGIALAAIGLWYDDYTTGGSPVTTRLQNALQFNAGPQQNDTTFQSAFPYVQQPWRGYDYTQQARF